MWIKKNKYNIEKQTLELLFLCFPMYKLAYDEIKKLVEQNYPYKNIINIMRRKYRW